MTLQYLTDKKGLREFVQIQIPIKEWEMADKKLVIEKDTEDELDSLTADDYRNYFLKRGKKMLAKSLNNYESYLLVGICNPDFRPVDLKSTALWSGLQIPTSK